ncbi:hypothetical protein [Microcoleus anatoxicus]|uniref:Uncharacterized protein n=1 Tax=Microcoleus anatoxicus PTRS2 TaxID=2705321 RepID=A0ABU8YSU8_9CYAN
MQSENIIEIYAEAECTVQPTVEYSIEDLEKILRVKRRQILNYSATICDCCWEPEIIFKPSFGKFSVRMLAEMRRLQSMGVTEYRSQCAIESGKPSTHKIESALVISPTVAISSLDAKIADLQKTSVVNSANLADRIRGKLAEIAQTNQLAFDRNQALSEAQMLAAENEGFEEALAIHSRRIAARDAALAQLKAMELQSLE